MAKFLQIGNQAYNLDLIESVRFYEVSGKTRVSLIPQNTEETYGFSGDEADTFIRWWNEHADVYVAT
jgi:hypothetical protein